MQRARDPLLIGATALLAGLWLLVLTTSVSWLGKPFPGFLVLENRIVASAGLAHWPATAGGSLYQQEIVSIDGHALESAAALAEQVAERPVGSPVRYGFRSARESSERVVQTRRFETLDWGLLFGSMLVTGLAFGVTALMIRYLRGRDQLATASFSILMVVGLWSITAADLYGPYRLFRLHALCETFLFAGVMHMALVFPHPATIIRRRPRLVWFFYGLAGVLAVCNQLGLHDPAMYRVTHLVATAAFGASLLFFLGTQFRWYLKPPDIQARQRVKVLALGAAASLLGPAVVTLSAAITGSETPQNVMAFTALFYPIAIGYAVLRHNLLDVDIVLRRTLSYAALTALAMFGYLGLVEGLRLAFDDSQGGSPDPLGVPFTILFVILILPLRDRVQSLIDRVFFRTSYDFRRIVETASARLASESDLVVISQELIDAVRAALHPERIRLHVRRSPDDPLGTVHVGPDNSSLDLAMADVSRRAPMPIDQPEGGLLVPFRAGAKLMAVLDLGRTQSGRMYGADDRRLLMTLANQGAVAIENALTLEGLRSLNRDLEEKVEERTAELREAHAQLVHREKMASLGQFVAGIAHELNNPLNFIQGNVYCLRESVDQLQQAIDAYQAVGEAVPEARDPLDRIRSRFELGEILPEIADAFAGCSEGIERSTTLVRDLRSFSRLDQPDRTSTDLEAALDSTLNLLRNQLTDVEVVKEYEGIPPVRCLAGQIDQVFVNLIANAADATPSGGRITLRTKRVGADRVQIDIEDTGKGIEEDHLVKIFDPFFTTKEVGKGTGLGLSISYGIIDRHGGTIRADSEPGMGARFRIELPIGAPAE